MFEVCRQTPLAEFLSSPWVFKTWSTPLKSRPRTPQLMSPQITWTMWIRIRVPEDFAPQVFIHVANVSTRGHPTEPSPPDQVCEGPDPFEITHPNSSETQIWIYVDPQRLDQAETFCLTETHRVM